MSKLFFFISKLLFIKKFSLFFLIKLNRFEFLIPLPFTLEYPLKYLFYHNHYLQIKYLTYDQMKF